MDVGLLSVSILVFLLIALTIGTFVGALLLRGSVAIVRSLFKPNGSSRPKQLSGWTSQSSVSQLVVDPSGPTQTANPYSAPVAATTDPEMSSDSDEKLPMPTIGKAALIIFLSFLVNFLIGLPVRLVTAGAPPDSVAHMLLQTFSFIVSVVAFIAILKSFLPTTYIWSFVVLCTYTILCIAIGIVVVVVLLLLALMG